MNLAGPTTALGSDLAAPLGRQASGRIRRQRGLWPARTIGRTSRPLSRLDRLALLVGRLTLPPTTAAAIILLTAWASHDAMAWAWAALCLVAAVGTPLTLLLVLLATGQVSDFQIKKRRERRRPMLASLAATGAVWLVMATSGAPRLLVVLGGAAIVEIVLIFLINQRWKISAHATSMAALATLLAMLFGGPLALAAGLAVPVVAWSRVQLGRHTPMQVLAGTFLGATVVFAALSIQP